MRMNVIALNIVHLCVAMNNSFMLSIQLERRMRITTHSTAPLYEQNEVDQN